MADDKKLVQGIRVFNPHANAPAFVKASIVITLNDLVKFGKDNPELLTEYNGAKQLKLQMLESRDGKLYVAVDTYKPGATTQSQQVPDPTEQLPF